MKMIEAAVDLPVATNTPSRVGPAQAMIEPVAVRLDA
jgi:hypothetical protein